MFTLCLLVLFPFSGGITQLVSAEMLAGALVLGTILTALPGKRKSQKSLKNLNLLLHKVQTWAEQHFSKYNLNLSERWAGNIFK